MTTAAYYIAGSAVSAVLLALVGWILYQRRTTPAQREQRRRLEVNRTRRTIEGFVTDVTEEMIHYRYELRGVTYFASQDVSSLRSLLPDNLLSLVGPVSVRYKNDNPANSIVLCEQWSGLPVRTDSAPEPLAAAQAANQPGEEFHQSAHGNGAAGKVIERTDTCNSDST